MNFAAVKICYATLIISIIATACGPGHENNASVEKPGFAEDSNTPVAFSLTDADVENIVRRSYQYVAMYNVNNKIAMKQGGWGTCDADTQLKDHTMREIARPNNDTLYTGCLLDLRTEAIVLNIPAFDSDYASLMITGYDHFVNIPLASRLGDFNKPETMLIYSDRTANYDGEPVKGVDHYFEATGDFISAVFRVMPHFTEPDRFDLIVNEMQSIAGVTLAEFQGRQPATPEPIEFPPVGKTDFDTFENNLLEVMQFVVNHTTFDPDYADDRAVLAAYDQLNVRPAQAVDSVDPAAIDGKRFREAAEEVFNYWLTAVLDPEVDARIRHLNFQPKGETELDSVLAVSIVGPIGIPQEEAVYPQLSTADGAQMNAQNDYVIRMTADELPPAGAFWSLTLYDLPQGFFIPNERKKYSVGENGGMQLGAHGGIEIYIAAEQPEGVPEDNWLPIERGDLDLSPQFRVYVPDLEAMKTWVPPKVEKL